MLAEERRTTRSIRSQETAPSLLPEQEQQLALISHMATFSDMLVAVTGPSGSGKTTLAYELLRRHGDLELTLFITADIMFGMPSLLRRIGDIDQLSLSESRSQVIDALRIQADIRAEEGKALLVVIDQAEQLDVDTLNEIAHLALLIPQGISFVLFGLSGYELNLRQGPAQATVHVQPLPPLTEAGAQQLLQKVYSPNQPLPLNETEFIYLYRQSAGIPGALILQAGDYFLVTADTKPKKKLASGASINERFPLTHIVALAVLGVALLASYWYQPETKEAAVIQLQPEPEDVLRGLPLPSKDDTYHVESGPVVVATITEPSSPPVSIDADDDITLEDVSVMPVAADYNYPATTERSMPSPVIKSTPAPIPTKSTTTPKIDKPTTAISDKQKLLAVKQGAVVQLFGSFELENASGFKQEWQGRINKTLYQYDTKNNGKDWYVVVVGVYKNKAEANKEIQNWPTKLKAAQPWVRDINDIKSALR